MPSLNKTVKEQIDISLFGDYAWARMPFHGPGFSFNAPQACKCLTGLKHMHLFPKTETDIKALQSECGDQRAKSRRNQQQRLSPQTAATAICLRAEARKMLLWLWKTLHTLPPLHPPQPRNCQASPDFLNKAPDAAIFQDRDVTLFSYFKAGQDLQIYSLQLRGPSDGLLNQEEGWATARWQDAPSQRATCSWFTYTLSSGQANYLKPSSVGLPGITKWECIRIWGLGAPVPWCHASWKTARNWLQSLFDRNGD